jgi:hypothetical protein
MQILRLTIGMPAHYLASVICEKCLTSQTMIGSPAVAGTSDDGGSRVPRRDGLPEKTLPAKKLVHRIDLI